MKQRFGAILCMMLGSVLIFSGFAAGSDATGGINNPTCGGITVGAVTVGAGCPVGTISVTETTDTSAASTTPTVPANWTVTITSTNGCLDPATNKPVRMTITVANGGTNASGNLYVFKDNKATTQCLYRYTETAVPTFTAAFAPTAPHSIAFNVDGSRLNVALTNTYTAPPPTSTPPSSSRPAPSSASAVATSLAPSSSAAALSNTGPRTQVRATLWIGIAVFLIGLAMLALGRRPRHGRVRN